VALTATNSAAVVEPTFTARDNRLESTQYHLHSRGPDVPIPLAALLVDQTGLAFTLNPSGLQRTASGSAKIDRNGRIEVIVPRQR
jgi:hypothetical protein